MHKLNYSMTAIAKSLNTDRTTVSRYLQRVEDSGLVIADPITEELAEQIRIHILSNQHSTHDGYLAPDWKLYHEELCTPHVTLKLLHEEYAAESVYLDKKSYSYPHFARMYREYCKTKRLVMRMEHKPGRVVEYDWAGSTMKYTAPDGTSVKMYLFVAVLPYSRLFYANAYPDMKLANWCDAVCNAFEYFEGVPEIMRPDNLKTAIIQHNREQIILQKDFRELSDHYNSAVIPTGVREPTHKSAAESTVREVECWIIGTLRKKQFFSVQEVQDAIQEEVKKRNDTYSPSLYSTPKDLFEKEERAHLKPLPPTRFSRSNWQTGTVPNDYMVKFGKNSYSVPYTYVGKPYEAREKNGMVEIYSDTVLITTHRYVEEHQRNVIVKQEHRPKNHQEVVNYTPEKLREYGQRVGPAVLWAMNYHLSSGKIEEQGIQFCVSIKSLGERHGEQKLEAVCKAIQERGDSPEIATITHELKAKVKATQSEMAHTAEGFTRGMEQFDI
ncbi:MAG: IS21 family transposase [Clostridia bacterium]|nr:IS21 family transposase [Clostridia bacterium]